MGDTQFWRARRSSRRRKNIAVWFVAGCVYGSWTGFHFTIRWLGIQYRRWTNWTKSKYLSNHWIHQVENTFYDFILLLELSSWTNESIKFRSRIDKNLNTLYRLVFHVQFQYRVKQDLYIWITYLNNSFRMSEWIETTSEHLRSICYIYNWYTMYYLIYVVEQNNSLLNIESKCQFQYTRFLCISWTESE